SRDSRSGRGRAAHPRRARRAPSAQPLGARGRPPAHAGGAADRLPQSPPKLPLRKSRAAIASASTAQVPLAIAAFSAATRTRRTSGAPATARDTSATMRPRSETDAESRPRSAFCVSPVPRATAPSALETPWPWLVALVPNALSPSILVMIRLLAGDVRGELEH